VVPGAHECELPGEPGPGLRDEGGHDRRGLAQGGGADGADWVDKLYPERLDRLTRDLRYQFKVLVQSQDCQFGHFGGCRDEKVGN